jgi:hypothetical protein
MCCSHLRRARVDMRMQHVVFSTWPRGPANDHARYSSPRFDDVTRREPGTLSAALHRCWARIAVICHNRQQSLRSGVTAPANAPCGSTENKPRHQRKRAPLGSASCQVGPFVVVQRSQLPVTGRKAPYAGALVRESGRVWVDPTSRAAGWGRGSDASRRTFSANAHAVPLGGDTNPTATNSAWSSRNSE